MSRNYGSLGRRSSNAAWQWVVIGLIIGLGCSATLFLGALAFGVVSVGGTGLAFGPSPTPIVITATPLPVTPTTEPTEIIITPTEEIQAVIEAPTATPTTDPTQLTPLPTETPMITATPQESSVQATESTGGQVDTLAASGPPESLLRLAGEMVDVAGGQFAMGTTTGEAATAVRDCRDRDGGNCVEASAEDSFPQHLVNVSPFRMEVTEVSYEQYLAFLNWMGPGSHLRGCNGQPCMATRSESDTSNVTYDSANYDVPDVINNVPVVEVTWYGAQAYCEALSRRLPTEAEWERAARGDNGFVYPWGDTWDAARAWTNRSAPDDGAEGGPVAVDSFPLGSSPYGIVNMAGNVAEWVSDWYDEGFYFTGEATQPDPVGPPLGDTKVVRGGSWDAVPFFARTMHRQSQRPGTGTPWIGFRCAADPAGPATPVLGGQTNLPIGADPLLSPTPDPATLGLGDEGDLGNSAPTLSAPPTQAQAQPTLPAGDEPVATLAPG